MATDVEIIQAIDRMLRAQPRNPDALLICEELKVRVVAHRTATMPSARSDDQPTKLKTDRRAYQRDLMRKRRAEGKAK